MAVREVSGVRIFTGTTQDEKPSGVPAGSKYYEFDGEDPPNVREFMYDGSDWGLLVKATEEIPAA